MQAETLASSATALAFGAGELGAEFVLLWSEGRHVADSPPARLYWPVAYALMCLLGMDVSKPNAPQQGCAGLRCKNGSARIEGRTQPTELGPSFHLDIQRR